MSGLINKVKEALHSDHHSNTNTTPEGTHGPHSSRAANAADPRVDSDRDGSRTAGNTTHTGAGLTGTGHTGTSGLTGTHGHTGTSGLTGTHGHTGTSGLTGTGAGVGGYGTGPAPNTAGPHKSDVLNKADPRVDSDLDGGRNTGTHGHTGTSGLGHTGAGTGFGHSTNTTAGPHRSDALNKADPRVDSDLDGSRTAGGAGFGTTGHSSGLTGTGHTGAGLTGTHGNQGVTGYNDPTGTHGPHSSRVANAADPRVDSDRDGSRTAGTGAGFGTTGHTGHSSGLTGTGHTGAGLTGHTGTHGHTGLGSGPAPNTAGPHKSDALNKLDPRVDSDRDGSKTLGNNNQTYQS